ncbi:MAG: EamA family transporter [Campylobacteraceae bacterium]|nr:EamA family transporter [Campylobacteraceae bacterium]
MQQVFKGNLFGILAILLWSTLASLSVKAGKIPPFQLVSMTFFIAFLIGLFLWKKEGKGILIHLKLPIKVWLVGIVGLFGYHFFYFLALQNAPALEANLINYLWPLFIVLFSVFLPSVKLRWFHILGVLLGLFGVIVLIGGGGNVNFDMRYIRGYSYAFLCAIIWSSYSVISKYFDKISTSVVGSFCGATAILSLIFHLAFEPTVIPSFNNLLAIIILGLGPVGGAFFAWDYGVKNVDIQMLGTFSYATPLVSTFLLVMLGIGKANSTIWLSCLLIVLGSVVASLPLFLKYFKFRNQRHK